MKLKQIFCRHRFKNIDLPMKKKFYNPETNEKIKHNKATLILAECVKCDLGKAVRLAQIKKYVFVDYE